MTLRRIKTLVVAVVLFILFLAPDVTQPLNRGTLGHGATTTSSLSEYEWVGCYRLNLPGSTCRNVFYDTWTGIYYWCRGCGPMEPSGCDQAPMYVLVSCD
jgi:hypothetical protein